MAEDDRRERQSAVENSTGRMGSAEPVPLFRSLPAWERGHGRFAVGGALGEFIPAHIERLGQAVAETDADQRRRDADEERLAEAGKDARLGQRSAAGKRRRDVDTLECCRHADLPFRS